MRKIQFVLICMLVLVACKKSVDGAAGNNSSGIISESSVPSVVLTSFNVSFSSSTEREWRHSSDNNFTCQFNMDNKRHEAAFDDKGHESHHSVISLDAPVPAMVLKTFSSSFPTDIATEWNFTSDGNWKVHFIRSGVQWEVTFSNTGSIIKQEHN